MRLTELGIDHVSPSQLNRILNAPGVWYLEKIRKVYATEAKAKAWRGSAVEKGLIHLGLNKDCSTADAIQVAMLLYEDEVNRWGGDPEQADIGEVGASLADFICAGEPYFRKLDPTGLQDLHRISDVLPVDVIGYSDLTHGDTIIDVKTTERIPSSWDTVSGDHKRQMAFYMTATGKKGRLVYVSGKKYNTIDVPDESVAAHWGELVAAGRYLVNLAAAVDSADDLARLIPPPDPGSFYLSDPGQRREAAKIWWN